MPPETKCWGRQPLSRGHRSWKDTVLSPQENSEAAKQELCARFDAFSALLEEKKTELLGRITREQEDKTSFVQGLIHKYKEQLEKSSRLVETAIQAMEETGGAAFLMVRPATPKALTFRGEPLMPHPGGTGTRWVLLLCHPHFSSCSHRTPSSSLKRKCPNWGNLGDPHPLPDVGYMALLYAWGCGTTAVLPPPGLWRPPRAAGWRRLSKAMRTWMPSQSVLSTSLMPSAPWTLSQVIPPQKPLWDLAVRVLQQLPLADIWCLFADEEDEFYEEVEEDTGDTEPERVVAGRAVPLCASITSITAEPPQTEGMMED